MSALERIAELHSERRTSTGTLLGDCQSCGGEANGHGLDPVVWPCSTYVLATHGDSVHETWAALAKDRDPQEALDLAQALDRDQEPTPTQRAVTLTAEIRALEEQILALSSQRVEAVQAALVSGTKPRQLAELTGLTKERISQLRKVKVKPPSPPA